MRTSFSFRSQVLYSICTVAEHRVRLPLSAPVLHDVFSSRHRICIVANIKRTMSWSH